MTIPLDSHMKKREDKLKELLLALNSLDRVEELVDIQ